MANSHYEGENLSELYKKTRAELPNEVIEKILSLLEVKFNPKECVAIDVGCGPGQSSIPLSRYLKHITGIDVSESQLEAARKSDGFPKNIEIKLGSAENLPAKDSSVHLVYSAVAAHWFNIDKFLKEAQRVLKPGGVLVICTTITDFIIGDKTLSLLDLASDLSSPYWKTATDLSAFYDNIPLPYKDHSKKEHILVDEEITISNFMARMRSIAGVAQDLEKNPKQAEEKIRNFEARLMEMSSAASPESTFLVTGTYKFLSTRKPSH